MARRILFLHAGGLSAWRWQRGRVDNEGEFTADAEGLAHFAAYIGTQRGSVYFVLADVAEEGLQLEDIPYLRGRDRIALIKHKLGRHYPATPFTAALTLGRHTEGRRDERLLFAALTRPQQFEPWLKALKKEQAALAGVYSLAQIVTALAGPRLNLGYYLLVTWTRGGLRQTFVENGRMRFSRLMPLACATAEEAAGACAREVPKIYHYLDGQRLIAAGAALAVRVLLHPAQRPAFEAHCTDRGHLHYEYPDLQAHGARCGLKTPLPDSHAEALFAHLLVRHTPRAQFAHADARHVFRVGRLRGALRFAGCAVLVACLLFAAAQIPELQRLDAAIAAIRNQNRSDEHRYRAMLAALPELPLKIERLLALTGRYEALLRRSPGPAPMYRRLSAALGDSPEIGLERLNWTVADRSDGAAASEADAGAYAVADIEAALPPDLAEDLHRQKAAIERFTERLRRDKAVEVRLLRLPFDAESAKALTGSGDMATPAAPKFTLRIVQRLERP